MKWSGRKAGELEVLLCHARKRADPHAESLTLFSSSAQIKVYQPHLVFDLERVGGKADVYTARKWIVHLSTHIYGPSAMCQALGLALLLNMW